MDKGTGSAVTLEAFADRVGCHFTTASRLRAGQRMPGRELLGRIVQEFNLDPEETLQIFTREDPEEFGDYLAEKVFKREEAPAEAETVVTAEREEPTDVAH